jgi:hypothetical protein
MRSRTRTLLLALGLTGTAGCTSVLSDLPLLDRLTGSAKVAPLPAGAVGEPGYEGMVEGGPIFAAPGVVESHTPMPPETAPPPRMLQEDPMAKPMPYTPDDKPEDKKPED